MARLRNPILGDISGKVAGVVFSNNKSGAIIRKRVKGTNPKTAAQTAARNVFGSGSASWAALSGSEQSQYNEFAKSMYVPLKHKYQTKHTGAQAFRAIQTVVSGSTLKQLTTVVKKGTDNSVITHTVAPPAVVVTGPLSSVGANIKDGTNPTKMLRISDCAFVHTGAVSFTVNFDPSAVGGLTGTTFLDGNSLAYGFTAYLSSKVPNSNAAVKSKLLYNLGNTGVLTLTGGGCGGENAVKLSWDASSLISKFKSFLGAGNSSYLTVYVVGSNGTLAPVGSEFITLT